MTTVAVVIATQREPVHCCSETLQHAQLNEGGYLDIAESLRRQSYRVP